MNPFFPHGWISEFSDTFSKSIIQYDICKQCFNREDIMLISRVSFTGPFLLITVHFHIF